NRFHGAILSMDVIWERCLPVIGIFFLFVNCAFGQTIISNGTGGGPWNSPSTWVGGVIPNFSNSWEISIRNGDVVTIPNGYTVQADQLYIRTGGVLNIGSGGILDIVNGAGNDLTMAGGKLNIAGVLEVARLAVTSNTNASNVTVTSTGIYRHKDTSNSGVIGATWEDGATLEFTGFTTSAASPGNMNQSFY